MAYYVLDDNNNKVLALDEQGMMAVLQQAIESGQLTDIDPSHAWISMIKCCVTGGTNKIAFVTQAQYNQLEADGQLIGNCYYYITDDTTLTDIETQINDLLEGQIGLNEALETVNERLTDGETRIDVIMDALVTGVVIDRRSTTGVAQVDMAGKPSGLYEVWVKYNNNFVAQLVYLHTDENHSIGCPNMGALGHDAYIFYEGTQGGGLLKTSDTTNVLIHYVRRVLKEFARI